jgi:glucose/mannose-6-phosphate isomerase
VPSLSLDDRKALGGVDKSDMLGLLDHWGGMFDDALMLVDDFALPRDWRGVDAVVIAGVGGSGVAGDLVLAWLGEDLRVPAVVCRDYALPAFVTGKTIVVTVSFSGETEETLSCFVDGQKRKARLIALSTGGRLEKYAKQAGVPHLKITGKMPPRMGLPYLFAGVAKILATILESKRAEELKTLPNFLARLREMYGVESGTVRNDAKRLALKVHGHVPIVYAYPPLSVVALRWKSEFNENGKMPCKWEVLPELKHNEVEGWTRERSGAGFVGLLLRDVKEGDVVGADMENLKRYALEGTLDEILEFRAQGGSLAERLFSLIYLGEYGSVYLGILNGVDPSRVDVIRRLKEELRRQTRIHEKLDASVGIHA